jgi:hypothetical protein
LLTIIKIFNALGNDRPQILVRLEDCVLEGIISISEGKPLEEAMQTLHSQISSSMADLCKDDEAMSWFNLSNNVFAVQSTPLPSEIPSTPLGREFFSFHLFLFLTFLKISPIILRAASKVSVVY